MGLLNEEPVKILRGFCAMTRICLLFLSARYGTLNQKKAKLAIVCIIVSDSPFKQIWDHSLSL